MLLRKTKRFFSSFENPKINSFYERHSKTELKQILDSKRTEFTKNFRLRIPGRRAKIYIGTGKQNNKSYCIIRIRIVQDKGNKDINGLERCGLGKASKHHKAIPPGPK